MRCAIVVKDALSDNTHTFLTPDEGFREIVKLHDHLYRGALANELRLDIPFIPHITVAISPDANVCKRIADDINHATKNPSYRRAKPFILTEEVRKAIAGAIDEIDMEQMRLFSLQTPAERVQMIGFLNFARLVLDALARRTLVDLGPVVGKVYVHAPEDLILNKIQYYAISYQSKHVRDIGSIMSVSRSQIDVDYINQWVRVLQLDDAWQDIQEQLAKRNKVK